MMSIRSMSRPAVRLWLMLGFVCLGTGCSTFRQDWESSRCYSPPQQSIEGCWEGTWESAVNGHHGTLRAIVSRYDDNNYHARFHATFLRVLPYEFDTPLSVTQSDNVITLNGQTDLGWLAGGVFTYEGQADEHELNCNYCAAKDHGSFHLRRVGPVCESCD
jgi:hypothetical protein